MNALPDGAVDDLADFLVRTRWFAGKGRDFTVTSVTELAEVPGRVDESPHVVVDLVEVTYAGGAREVYQVPLALYPEPVHRLDHASVGVWELPGRGLQHAYDALHDREAMACYLRSFAATPPPDGPLRFRRLPGHELDLEVHSTLFAGEQSNSSVAFGEDSLMKLFRQVTAGVNPDIKIHEALTEAGSEHVAPLYGWLEATAADGEVLHLAMLQAFLRTATDGWDLGLASVRTLFAELDQHASESGGDFAGEAARLGEALAEVHETMADRFGVERLGPQACGELADGMIGRLGRAVDEVPQLQPYATRLRERLEAVRDLGGLEVQTIHGDLHLGQTLRTSLGWKIVDFEGEPARPLAERLRPDSRWRDIAGMLRSFDYAPGAVLAGMETTEEDRDQLLARAGEWTRRATRYFLDAYAGSRSAAEQQLLDAYVTDKAVYECVYESRNRPTWLDIPLAAVARLSEQSG